jgi:hypothetical protein
MRCSSISTTVRRPRGVSPVCWLRHDRVGASGDRDFPASGEDTNDLQGVEDVLDAVLGVAEEHGGVFVSSKSSLISSISRTMS